MTLEEYYNNTKIKNKVCLRTFQDRVSLLGIPKHEAIVKRVMTCEGKTIDELVPLTGKNKTTIRTWLYRHKNTTIKEIRDGKRAYNSLKHYVNGIPLTEYCRNNGYNYYFFRKNLRNGLIIPEIIKKIK